MTLDSGSNLDFLSSYYTTNVDYLSITGSRRWPNDFTDSSKLRFQPQTFRNDAHLPALLSIRNAANVAAGYGAGQSSHGMTLRISEKSAGSLFFSTDKNSFTNGLTNASSKSEHLLGTDKRDSLSETSEVHSDIGISSLNTRQPIWLRFLKEYNPINNAWSCFQPYRATAGLLAFAWCSSHSDIELRVKDYIKQKKLLSATLISSQLFLFLKPLGNENDSLSVEEANAFVSEMLKEDSALLGEIICHPSEHLFASEMNILKDFGYSAGTDECSLVDKSHVSIRPPFVNHRISSVLQALTSEIYWNLKKMLAAKCPSDIKLKKKESQLSKELTDSSDDLLMAPEENESKWNILDEVRRKALGRTNALSALSTFTDRSGSTSSISAQTDIRLVISFLKHLMKLSLFIYGYSFLIYE
ncbi:unnamed protein product [Schistosoma mattheei]|uniref:Uncharacterized protein n=1 Tax=Schistosoma mattheei TaxID=31246 RepID=A0A183P567_9TREM|nr:unnamed protein product [Schistosoma mattheei]